MSERDCQAMVSWFKWRIAMLEQMPHYPDIREGVNGLRGFVAIIEREMGERDGESR
jgi:hypothetical protein